jgi:hypothetical protein
VAAFISIKFNLLPGPLNIGLFDILARALSVTVAIDYSLYQSKH